MIEEPLTPLMAGATQLHELYEAWVQAGFTPEQSMQLLIATITTSILGAGPDST